MKQFYDDLRDYHSSGRGVEVQQAEWQSVRAAILHEKSNEVHFRETQSNALVLTLDGTKSHITRMEGIDDHSPSKTGEVCFIPKGAEAYLSWQNHDQFQKSVLFEFDQSMFKLYAPEVLSEKFEKGNLIPKNFMPCADLEYLIRIFGKEISTTENRGLLFVESAIRLIAIQISKVAWSHPATPERDRFRKDARATRAIEFIEEHFTRDISLLEIGAAAGLSVTQLTQVFEQATGQTPYAYVISRRLQQAVHLLRSSNTPIAHIAIDVGFADQAHLTRTFQRRIGKTPKTVRAEG